LNKSLWIAFAFAGLFTVWLASGQVDDEDTAVAEAPAEEAGQGITVRVVEISAQSFGKTLSLRGRTEARRSVEVKAETLGRIVALPTEKGASVKRGDVLCELAVDDREVSLNEAQAARERARIEYKGTLRLKKGGYQSEVAIAAAKAQLDATEAAVTRAELALNNIRITAPFDGVMDRQPVFEGDLLERGSICAVVIEMQPMLVVAQATEREVGELALNTQVDVQLVTGEARTGRIVYISKSADDVTRTYRVEVEIDNPDNRLIAGVTSDLLVQLNDTQAHHISPAVLALDDAGDVGVRIVNGDGVVELIPVTILHQDSAGIWVGGLPDQAMLITVGQEYVVPGKPVKWVWDQRAAGSKEAAAVESSRTAAN